MNILFLIIFLLFSFDLGSTTLNVTKLSCEYEPDLITKKQKNNDSQDAENLNIIKICQTFGCKDTVEILKDNSESNGHTKHLLRNSWFNHQGILLDDLSISKESITMNTVVSNAYFSESYLINRVTGETERIFYRFDNSEIFYKINELKKSKDNSRTLFNKDGRLSLKTLKKFSVEPWEIYYFKGKCLEGTGI